MSSESSIGCESLALALASTLSRGTVVTASNPRHFMGVLPRQPVALGKPRYELAWNRPYGAVREPSRADLAALWGGAASMRSLRREHERLGACDFVRQRSVRYDYGQGWSVFGPGRLVLGQDDGWHELGIDGTTLHQWDPLWLMALVGGTVSAELLDSGEQRAPGWRRYSGLADFEAASTVFGRPLATKQPSPGRWFEARGHCPFEILLDQEDLIRRVAVPFGRFGLELGDFGAPITIEFPPDNDIFSPPGDVDSLRGYSH